MPRAWFTGALHRAGSLLPFSPGSCWAPGGLSRNHARRREQQQQALSESPEPTRGSFSGDGCTAKSEKRRMGAARVPVCVCLPGCGCLCLRRGSRGGTQRGLPAAHRLRGRSGLAQPGARLGGGGARLRGPGRPLGVSMSPPLATLPAPAGAH